MKLVIHTQHKENYAAHDDGYVHGEHRPYWKYKGGSTYVVENVSVSAAMSVKDIVREIKPLIESRDSSFQEYVIDWGLHDDNETAWDEWDSPYMLSKEDDKWVASRIPSWYVKPVKESYIMLPAGGRTDYVVEELAA